MFCLQKDNKSVKSKGVRTWQKESKSLRLVEAAVTPRVDGRIYQRYEELPIREIWLVDVEEGKIVSQMSQRMWDASPYEVKIYATLDREEALKDADFVTTQFRVGQLDARIKTSGS